MKVKMWHVFEKVFFFFACKALLLQLTSFKAHTVDFIRKPLSPRKQL